MTRADFIRRYAACSDLSDEWAELGLVEIGNHRRIALPCGCGDETCPEWSMVPIEAVLDHLSLYAPEPLRTAYHEAVSKSGGAT